MSDNRAGLNGELMDIIDRPAGILFAHEEKQIIKLFFEILQDLEKKDKLNLNSVQSGYEMLDRLKEKSFDVIIIDEKLPSFDIPKVLHCLRTKHPDTKVMFLAKSFEAGLNELGSIQYCKKPFRFEDLRHKIADLMANPALCAKNILPVDIINTISSIREKSAIVIQNLANNSSGEMFIDNKKIIQASVEAGDKTLHDMQAVEEVLSWRDYEGCISKGTPFPEEHSYSIAVDTIHFHDKSQSDSVNTKALRRELSAEDVEQLQQYLNLAPYCITDHFVMNAFCTTDCITHASIKDPDYSEMLYKISDKIVATFVLGIKTIYSKSTEREVFELNDQFVMVLYKLQKDTWYYAILKDKEVLEQLDDIVSDFSAEALHILVSPNPALLETAEV